MHKIIAVVAAVAMGIGVVGFTMTASASPKAPRDTETNWAAWRTQQRPLYNASWANTRALDATTKNTSNSRWNTLLIAEVGVDANFASAADSPSAQLNANIILYARTDSQSAAYGLECMNISAISPACNSWHSLGNKAVNVWNRLIDEVNAAP